MNIFLFMKIKLNLNIFLFLILFLLTNQIEIYTLTMIFALIHELAHLTVGLILGFETDTFKIMPFGFCIEFKTNIKDYNKKVIKSNLLSVKKILIAFAGPVLNIIIVILGLIYKFKNDIIYANLLLFIFNMLPIYPLDGGKILQNTAKILFGNKKANRYTNIISNMVLIFLTIISSIIIIIYKNVAIFVIIVCLWIIMIKENKKYDTYKKIYKIIDKQWNYL